MYLQKNTQGKIDKHLFIFFQLANICIEILIATFNNTMTVHNFYNKQFDSMARLHLTQFRKRTISFNRNIVIDGVVIDKLQLFRLVKRITHTKVHLDKYLEKAVMAYSLQID